jgi:hypothetical protein
MAPGERPVSAAVIQREFRKGRAKLSGMRKKKKLPADREVIDLQIKTLSSCEQLLKNILLI